MYLIYISDIKGKLPREPMKKTTPFFREIPWAEIVRAWIFTAEIDGSLRHAKAMICPR